MKALVIVDTPLEYLKLHYGANLTTSGELTAARVTAAP